MTLQIDSAVPLQMTLQIEYCCGLQPNIYSNGNVSIKQHSSCKT